MGKLNVLGVGVDAVNMTEVKDLVGQFLREKRRGYVCLTNVYGVSEAQRDLELRGAFNRALLSVPDGMPLVWLGRMQRSRNMGRVYGPDLMLEICRQTEGTEYSHFLYGGKEGVAELLCRRLKERFPRLTITGTFTPPFRPLSGDEERALVEMVSSQSPDIIWVGLGTPKQEQFMADFIGRLDTTLMFGVGAAFDFHTGLVPQAPRWMQRSGLEWLFRLGSEPRRLWRRYLINNPLFVWRILWQVTGLKSYDLEDRHEG